MMKRIRLPLVVIMLALALAACSKEEAPPKGLPKNETVTEEAVSEKAASEDEATEEPVIFNDFELIALDGTKTSLYAYEGKTIILNFWATWCGFCVEEMPLLEELNKRDDIVVLAVSAGEDFDTVRAYIEENGYTFDVFVDEEGALAAEFLVQGLPTSFFIGPDFEYYFSYPGMLTDEMMEKMLEDIKTYQSGD